MRGITRVVFFSLLAIALVASSLIRSSSVAAQGKPKQRTALVVFGPTGNSKATGNAFVSITDQNVAAGPMLIARIEVAGMPTGLFATHIHEGFCPPPVGPEPDQQGPIRVDFKDTIGFDLAEKATRSLITVSVLKASDLPTRSGGITNLNDLLDPNRNFYMNIHQRANGDPKGIGPGLTCGRLEFR